MIQLHLGIIDRDTFEMPEDSEVLLNSSTKPQPKAVNIEKFQLILYVSYPSPSESIALQLLEAYDSYCQRNGKKSFCLTVRFSQDETYASALG